MVAGSVLVIGLGSMGKRRIRCLRALGVEKIVGFDLREDRRREAEEKYQIETFAELKEVFIATDPKAIVISVPPDLHSHYMKIALERRIPFFVEVNILDTDFDLINEKSQQLGIVAAPSATFRFHPAIRIIEKLVQENSIGKVSNIVYHSGQYLPDWHTYEKVSEYYVSNPLTGGAREIVPFELTWLTGLFGFPKKVSGNFRKTIDIVGAEKIEDTYNFLLDYEDKLATITIDCVSRVAVRRLLVNADEGQILWSWDKPVVQLYQAKTSAWREFPYTMSSAEKGYHSNIGEDMYVEELKSFLISINGKSKFINSLEQDHRVLKLLYAIEESDKTGKVVSV